MNKPTRAYAFFIAGGFAAAGIIGATVNNRFSIGPHPSSGLVLGVLRTNGWHNLFHFALFPVALWIGLSKSGRDDRLYALWGGLLYTVLGLVGLARGDDAVLFNRLPLNTPDSLIHLALGLAGLAAYWAVTRRRATTTPSAAVGTALR